MAEQFEDVVPIVGEVGDQTTNPDQLREHATVSHNNLISLTVFTGAFLLFQVQLLLGKYILPWFGGAPGVWMYAFCFSGSAFGRKCVFALCRDATAAFKAEPAAQWDFDLFRCPSHA